LIKEKAVFECNLGGQMLRRNNMKNPFRKYEKLMSPEIKAAVYDSSHNIHARHVILNLEQVILMARDLLSQEQDSTAEKILETNSQALIDYIDLLKKFPEFKAKELERTDPFPNTHYAKYFPDFQPSKRDYDLEYVALAKKKLLNTKQLKD
jgi:hypothetical protein